MLEEELAKALFRAERDGLEEAMQSFFHSNPDLQNANSVVFNLAAQGRHEEALERFNGDNFSHFRPKKYLKFRGELMYAAGEYKEARSCFYRVGKTDFSEVVGKMGVCSYHLGKYGEALTHLNQATSMEDTSGLYWSYLGLTQFQLDQIDKAFESFEEAKRLNSLTEEAREVREGLESRVD